MDKIVVRSHNKQYSNGTLKHTAIVELNSYDGEINNEFIFNLSEKVGYHPYGYGIYGGNSYKEIEPNVVEVHWTTEDSAD